MGIVSLSDSFEKFIADQRQNAVLWVPVLLGCGIGFYFDLHAEPGWFSGTGVFLAAIIAAAGIWLYRREVTPAFLISLIFVFFFLGFAVAQGRTHLVTAPVLQKSLDPVMVEGTIKSLDSLEEGKGTRVILENLLIEKLTSDKTPYSVRLSIRKDNDLKPGQRIRVLAGLNPPSPPVTPSGYDFQRYAWFKRIGAFGFAYKAPEILSQGEGNTGWLETFRQNQANHVRDVVPEPESSIVSALLLGERAAIPEDAWADIRAAGLAHVISISGLHIGLIAGGIFFVLRFLMALFPRFALYHPIKKYAACAALAGCTMYAVMVGLSVPTVRSVIMTGFVLLAVMLDRSPFSLRLVAFAAVIILLSTPEAMTGPSFQMSFAAVAALIFFYDKTRNFWSGVNHRYKWGGKIFTLLAGMVMTSVIATIATAPFSLYHFQQFPFYSVVGNVLAMPVISFVIMPAAVFAYILMPFGLHDIALSTMGWGVHAMLEISSMIAAWPYATIPLKVWPLSSLLCFTAAGIILMLVEGRARWVFTLPLIAGIVLVSTHKLPDILVSSSGKLMMVRMGDEIYLSSKRADKFTAETWVREIGQSMNDVKTWPREGEIIQGTDRLQCDRYACMAKIKGHDIAFSFDPRSVAEDCRRAEIVIAAKPIKPRNCAATISFGLWELRDGGVHALYLDQNSITLETVSGERGTRPWTGAGNRR